MVQSNWEVFTGVHRNFSPPWSPPRIKPTAKCGVILQNSIRNIFKFIISLIYCSRSTVLMTDFWVTSNNIREELKRRNLLIARFNTYSSIELSIYNACCRGKENTIDCCNSLDRKCCLNRSQFDQMSNWIRWLALFIQSDLQIHWLCFQLGKPHLILWGTRTFSAPLVYCLHQN